jgi:hypothetical protein
MQNKKNSYKEGYWLKFKKNKKQKQITKHKALGVVGPSRLASCD